MRHEIKPWKQSGISVFKCSCGSLFAVEEDATSHAANEGDDEDSYPDGDSLGGSRSLRGGDRVRCALPPGHTGPCAAGSVRSGVRHCPGYSLETQS